ncbi:MAG: nuclear transport factor 2 family protein [Chloroflexi bacterium]|nr:nuclear transport factor 2 family protein [Chloroflexota bacterium]
MPEKDMHSSYFSREKSNRYSQSAILIAALAAVLGILPTLYAWAVRYMLRRNLQRLKAGDVEPIFNTYADDVRFVFPGQNSWAADLRGKDAVEQWVRRFVRIGLQLEPHEILVMGPPWDTTICLRFTDRFTAPDGNVVYTNHGTIFGKIVWGKLTYYELHEDTEKVTAFDKYLALHEPIGP